MSKLLLSEEVFSKLEDKAEDEAKSPDHLAAEIIRGFLMEKQATPKNVWLSHLDPETRELIGKEAKLKGEDPEEFFKTIIREQLKRNATDPNEDDSFAFEDNCVPYKRVTIALPESIYNLYVYRAMAQGKDDFILELIAFDVAEKIRSMVEGWSKVTSRKCSISVLPCRTWKRENRKSATSKGENA